MRQASITRNTKETRITAALNLDGRGESDISTGCGFLDHMLELFARHGRFDLTVKCEGDIHVDAHHTVEDCAIVLGRCFAQALGDMRGINRYGSMILPMDETLMLCAVDLSGRAHLGWQVTLPAEQIGNLTPNWARSSGRASSATAPVPCISIKWRGRTPTIFWRPASRAWPGPCGRRWPLNPVLRIRSPAPRVPSSKEEQS